MAYPPIRLPTVPQYDPARHQRAVRDAERRLEEAEDRLRRGVKLVGVRKHDLRPDTHAMLDKYSNSSLATKTMLGFMTFGLAEAFTYAWTHEFHEVPDDDVAASRRNVARLRTEVQALKQS